jgi:hypothetical protein
MRDILRDAALITVAQAAMKDKAYMGVETFIQTYAQGEKDQRELRASLCLFSLIEEKYEKRPWQNDGEYIWQWWTED